ncbi:MAG: ribonuclease III family protein [Promethearchaeota archaeon]
MDYEFLIKDLNLIKTQKAIGTDKGLAKIGDGIVNLTYSVAKSAYLTTSNSNSTILRTGVKVSKKILSTALKISDLKKFAKTRADAHDLADTAEALIAYVWLSREMSLDEIIDFLFKNLSGDLNVRNEEITNATEAFTKLLIHIKRFLPVK